MRAVHSFNTRGLMLVFLVGAWLVGMVLDSLFPLPLFALGVGVMMALLFLVPLRRDAQGRFIMLLVAWLLLGATRYTLASSLDDVHSIRALIGTKKLTLQGTVVDEPKLVSRSRILIIAVSEVQQNGTWQAADGQLAVTTLGSQVEDPYGANYGDMVELQGTLQAPSGHTSISTIASMSFPRISVYENQGNAVLAFFYHVRLLLAGVITQVLPQPEAALLVALALSLRTPALQSLATVFNAIGCAHLIAPSGYKVTVFVALIEAGVKQLFRFTTRRARLLPAQLRWHQWSMTGSVSVSVIAFTVLSGAVPAALRAGLMGVLIVLATPAGRRYNVYTALALATFVLSLQDPLVLWDVGFQLSFLGTLGIVLLTPYFQRILAPVGHLPFGHVIVEIVAVTLAAQVATLPLIMITFKEVSFIAPIANILTVPLFSTLILLGLVIACVGLVSLPVASLLGWLAYPLLRYVTTITHVCYALPFAYMSVTLLSNMTAWITWGYYAVCAVLASIIRRRQPPGQPLAVAHPQALPFSKKLRYTLQIGAALIIIVATGMAILTVHVPRQLSIVFLNVGPSGKPSAGEAIFVQTPDDKTILIDGGSDSTSLAMALDSHLPSWQRSLDAVVLTSPRADDLAGLQDVVTRYKVGEVIDAGMLHPGASYALWRSTIQQHGIHSILVSQGALIRIGTQVTLQVLWPSAHLHKGSNELRDNSMVLRLVSPKLRLLLLGDVALSPFGLTNLLTSRSLNFQGTEIVQIVGDVGKTFPNALEQLLYRVQPAYLIVSPTTPSSKLRKHITTTAIIVPRSWAQDMPNMHILQTAQRGSIVITTNDNGWIVGV